MRRLAVLPMVLLAVISCKRSTTGPMDGQAPSASASAAPSVDGPVSSPADPVPGQYGRFFIDLHRFSAAFPVSPVGKPLPGFMMGVEANTEDGSAYVVICRPSTHAGHELDHAREQTVGSGTLLSESHPSFYTGDAYEVHARLPDGSERFMRFVRYGGRFCSVGAEIVNANREPDATRFIESFRPEPAPQ